jgi:hypothetical protein
MVISYVIKEPMSSSNQSLVRSSASWMTVTFASQIFGKDLRISFLISTLI